MPSKVSLHIYDVGTDVNIQKVNEYLTAVGTGAFHGGIEVYHKEYSYGYSEEGTGVFECPPKGCTAHHYRESHKIGTTKMSEDEVVQTVEDLRREWPGKEYDLLRHNCVIFSDILSQRLGVGAIPAWCTNLAGAGATLQDGAVAAATAAQRAAIITAAKAGEIDAQYNVRGTAQAKAKDFIVAARDIDKQYRIQDQATAAASAAAAGGAALASKAATKAAELDHQHKIRQKASTAATEAATAATQAARQGGALASQAVQQLRGAGSERTQAAGQRAPEGDGNAKTLEPQCICC